MKTLLKNARILTMDGEDIFFGEILIEDKYIKKIDLIINEDADLIIDCKDNLLMPGFKNAHAHTAMVFARSIADDLPLHKWLFDTIFPMEAKFKKNDIYHLTKLGILEYIKSGITAAFDMYFNPNEIIKASLDLGFRNVILATSDKESIEEIKQNYIQYNKKDDLISYRIGIHAEYTTSYERIKEIASLINELKCPCYLHVSETKSEVDDCLNRYKLTPVKFLDSLGFFNYGGGGFHSIYLTDEEIDIYKKKGVYVISCPASNLKLASGIAPLDKYQKAGLNIALGTDGAASNNSLDMFKEMYLASTLSKVMNNDASSMDGYEVLKMATVNSAHAMGLFDADILAENKLADIIMIDLQSPNMQPINNIAKNIVYAGSKDIIKMTMINGKILYYNNKFAKNIHPNTIYKKAQNITDRLAEIENEKRIQRFRKRIK